MQSDRPGLDECNDLRVRLSDNIFIVDHDNPVADLQPRQTRRSAVLHVFDEDRLHRSVVSSLKQLMLPVHACEYTTTTTTTDLMT